MSNYPHIRFFCEFMEDEMNYRIFVEKKMGFNLESIRLKDEIIESFNLNELKDLRIVNIYDIFGIDKKNYEESKKMIFSEMPTDEVYESLEACLDSNIVESEKVYFTFIFESVFTGHRILVWQFFSVQLMMLFHYLFKFYFIFIEV